MKMTDFENELLSKLNEAKPDNKITSHKSYVRCLRLLSKKNKEDEFKNIDFAKDKDLVESLTSDLSDSTKRNYLTSCANGLRLENKNDELTQIIKYYEDKVKEYNTQFKKNNEDGYISDKQKPAFDIGIDGLVDMIYKMEKDIKNDPVTYVAYMIYNILLQYPLRNEVGRFVKISSANFKKLKTEAPLTEEFKDINYLVIPSNIYKKNIKMVSTEYKTNKIYGVKTVEIKDKKLRKKLIDYIKYTGGSNSGPLFKYKDNALDDQTVTNILMEQSKKYTGIGIGTTMFYKITVSAEAGEIHKTLKEKAIARGQSMSTQSSSYIKISKPE